MRGRPILAAAAMLAATPVQADWNGIRWQASRGEVRRRVTFSLHDAPALNNSSVSPDLVGAVTINKFALNARFLFDDRDKLVGVRLRAETPGQCPELRKTLFTRYGYVDPDGPGRNVYTWTEPKSHNLVIFVGIGGAEPTMCGYEYSQLPE